MISGTMPPSTSSPTPAQNIVQFARMSANVPMMNAIVTRTTPVQAAGVDPWGEALMDRSNQSPLSGPGPHPVEPTGREVPPVARSDYPSTANHVPS